MNVVIVVGAAIVLVAGIRHHLETRGLSDLITETGENDDNFACEVFSELLNDAQAEMMIYDDGGKDSPIYDDENMVEEVKRRLQENGGLQLFCLFTYKERTAFWNAFEKEPRVHMKKRSARSDLHYKIIDGGRKGYLTVHRVNSSVRQFRRFDCSNVRPRDMNRVIKHTMGPYIDCTRTEFADARA